MSCFLQSDAVNSKRGWVRDLPNEHVALGVAMKINSEASRICFKHQNTKTWTFHPDCDATRGHVQMHIKQRNETIFFLLLNYGIEPRPSWMPTLLSGTLALDMQPIVLILTAELDVVRCQDGHGLLRVYAVPMVATVTVLVALWAKPRTERGAQASVDPHRMTFGQVVQKRPEAFVFRREVFGAEHFVDPARGENGRRKTDPGTEAQRRRRCPGDRSSNTNTIAQTWFLSKTKNVEWNCSETNRPAVFMTLKQSRVKHCGWITLGGSRGWVQSPTHRLPVPSPTAGPWWAQPPKLGAP